MVYNHEQINGDLNRPHIIMRKKVNYFTTFTVCDAYVSRVFVSTCSKMSSFLSVQVYWQLSVVRSNSILCELYKLSKYSNSSHLDNHIKFLTEDGRKFRQQLVKFGRLVF